MEVKDNGFGMAVRAARVRCGLTLDELGAKVGIDKTYLSKIEHGHAAPPSRQVIEALAQALSVPLSDLLEYVSLNQRVAQLEKRVKVAEPATEVKISRLVCDICTAPEVVVTHAVQSVGVGPAGELHVMWPTGSVTIYAPGQWLTVETRPADEIKEA